ncbi:MAG: PilZ domain-containing protein [Thermodesulfovibrionia bacterium]|nr:PilZ domain-containing protein [Thermodesulfovibrionia bacterium]
MGKRITQRKIRRLPITFSDGTVEYSGTSSDFSTTGLFIRTRKALSPGTPVKMVIELDNNRRINLTGVVVRSIKTGIADFKNGMGIKLTSIPQEYQDFINELLRSS